MSAASFLSAADVVDGWRDDVLTGRAPVLYPAGAAPLDQIELGPGLVTLIGGAPGQGKTALTMQLVTDAVRMNRTLRALVCNVEMPPSVLLDRQLARLSGVDLTAIRYRRLTEEHGERIAIGINTLASIADRLCFLRAPFDLTNVAGAADAFGADLLCLDYIQRIGAPGNHADKRGSIDASMNYLRQFADAGVSVLVVSAVGRGRDRHGRSSYDGEALSLASFRESSELEFGADSAFILTAEKGAGDARVCLRHLKDRHGECRDIDLRFDRARQAFSGDPEGEAQDKGKLTEALYQAWNRTEAAPEGEEGEA